VHGWRCLGATGCTWENVARRVGDRSDHVGRHVRVHGGHGRHRQGAAGRSVVYLGRRCTAVRITANQNMDTCPPFMHLCMNLFALPRRQHIVGAQDITRSVRVETRNSPSVIYHHGKISAGLQGHDTNRHRGSRLMLTCRAIHRDWHRKGEHRCWRTRRVAHRRGPLNLHLTDQAQQLKFSTQRTLPGA